MNTTEFNNKLWTNRRLSKRLLPVFISGCLTLYLAAASPHAIAACDPAPGSTVAGLPDYACFDASQTASLYAKSTSYRIMRKGKRIGKHSIQIEKSTTEGTEEFTVAVNSRIKVTILKVPVFSFNYQATEVWQDGMLQKVEAETTENSTKTVVSAVRQGAEFVLTQNQKRETVSGLEHASNHWNPAVLRSTSLFNTLTGKRNSVQVELLGVSRLDLPAGSIEATHFRYTGNLQAEVWYDNNGRWVQLKFEGDDGSVILYQLETQA